MRLSPFLFFKFLNNYAYSSKELNTPSLKIKIFLLTYSLGATLKQKAVLWQTVYDEAYLHNNKAFLCFICHEICHAILFHIGFMPTSARSIIKGKETPAYRSVEWQAKALCGELTIPYDATIGMNANEIMELYPVTKASAKYRVKLDKK